MARRLRHTIASTLVASAVMASGLFAQGSDATSLSKATQNPVSDLISVPFQFNYFSGGGLGARTLSVLNFQPVVPLGIGTRWNLVARTIVPFLNVPGPSDRRFTGTGDIIEQIFFTHAKTTDPIWGVGPMFSFPTATNVTAETGDWGLGPAAVIVKTIGAFVLGGLITQVWTIAGNDEGGHLNAFSVQPFINYNLADGWAISSAPTITSNWSLTGDDRWTVPIGIGVSKVTSIGRQPMSLAVQYYANVVRPPTSGSAQIRFVASFLFPKVAAK
jgi:hypothetical protein